MITAFKNADVDFTNFNQQNPYFHVIETLRQNVPQLSGLKVLDIGCGRERKYQILDFKLAKLGCIVTGIDIEGKNETVGNNLRFVKSAAEDFITKEKFDAIISTFFLGYVTSDWAKGNGLDPREYELRVLKKLHSLLAENGISVHYTHEGFQLSEEDIASAGFNVIRFPQPDSNPENGILIMKRT